MTERLMLDWLTARRDVVEARLQARLGAIDAERLRLAPQPTQLVQLVRGLSLRGGKRMRPLLLLAAFEDLGGASNKVAWEAAQEIGVYFELLQTYLLIHDDWMDQDAERRGAPTAHVAMVKAGLDVHTAATLAVLAGDLSYACAHAVLAALELPKDVRIEIAEFERAVIYGQELDVLSATGATDDGYRTTMRQLKTTSYSVRGPIRVGAQLAGSDAATLNRLTQAAEALGEAFQLQDDVLNLRGTDQLGKTCGGDLLMGKGEVVAEAKKLTGSARERFEGLLQRIQAGDPRAVPEVSDWLVEVGVVETVAARVRMEYARARTLLQPQETRLAHLVDVLEQRQS